MADDKKVLEVESEETQPEAISEEKTPVEEPEETVSEDVKKPEETAAWESLTGKTQDRIVNLVRERNALRAELERTKNQPAGSYVPPAPTQSQPTDAEVKDAVGKLAEYGVATKEELEKLKDDLQGSWYLENENQRLGTKYSGSDGRPKYVKEEVEDHARRNYFGGNLEAAYRDLYYDELVDYEAKSRKSKATTYTEKPSASMRVGDKPLTLESLRERLRKPDGAKWWDKNREKIEPLLPELSQE